MSVFDAILRAAGQTELGEGVAGALARRMIGSGRSKAVFADPEDAGSVIVEMKPNAASEAFLDFARDAHREGRSFARHLPDPGVIERYGDGVRFRTARLDDNPTRARVGRENGAFYMTGLPEDDPQRAAILEAMNALDGHLQATMPAGRRYFFDLNPQNFMRRADGTLVINDPVELASLLAGLGLAGGAGGGAFGALERQRQGGAA